MAVSLTGSISITANVTDIRTAVAGALTETGKRELGLSGAWAILSGTGAGLADRAWGDRRTVLTTATDVIDLAGLQTNAFAEATTFVRVRGIAIVPALTNTTTLTITRPAANGALLFGAASGTIAALGGGGLFAWADPVSGFAVAAGTTDLLNVVNAAGASAVYDIFIVGTSA